MADKYPVITQRRTLTVLAITQIFGTIGLGVAPSIGVLLAGIVTDNEAFAGIARTASTFGAALFGIPLATFASRFGRRPALSVGWFSAAIGALILAGAAHLSSLPLLVCGLTLIGAGNAAGMQTRFAATDRAPAGSSGKALALIVWVGTIGSVLGPNLGVPGRYLGQLFGLNLYAAAFALAALMLAVAGTLIFTLLRPDPLQQVLAQQRGGGSTTATTGQPPRGYAAKLAATWQLVCSNRNARYATVTLVGAHIVMVAIMTMTPVHLQHHGGSIELIGITISLHVLGMYGLSPLAGYLGDRIGARPTILFGTFLLATAIALCFGFADSHSLMILALTLLGFGWSFVFVPASALYAVSLPAAQRATAQGGLDAVANLCAALAALSSGLVMYVTSFPSLALLCGVFLVPLLLLRPQPAAG